MKRLVVLVMMAAACAPSLRKPKADGGVDGGALDGGAHYLTQRPDDGGTFAFTDATSDQRWAYLDLDTGDELLEPPSDEWDLGFQRFLIKSNGGISGAGGVSIARLEAGFDAVTRAPADGYAVDAVDGDDEGTSPDYVFNAQPVWFEYESRFHTLTPRNYVYVVRSTEGAYFKVRITSFYDDNGTSGFMQFLWAPIAAP